MDARPNEVFLGGTMDKAIWRALTGAVLAAAVVLGPAAAGSLGAGSGRYIGTETCAGCHEKEFNNYKKNTPKRPTPPRA